VSCSCSRGPASSSSRSPRSATRPEHGQSFSWSEFFPQFFASTFENWQSEFLQLLWQAGGLAFLYFWGSSQSKESDDRMERKLDALLRDRNLDPDKV
jgi:hypothetical protein